MKGLYILGLNHFSDALISINGTTVDIEKIKEVKFANISTVLGEVISKEESRVYHFDINMDFLYDLNNDDTFSLAYSTDYAESLLRAKNKKIYDNVISENSFLVSTKDDSHYLTFFVTSTLN